ncbi:hypothetical protein BHE74_00014482 [Ensete ventricosum]|nr:hypothetical protein BHE74_00014482 [Ensete ventricosum]
MRSNLLWGDEITKEEATTREGHQWQRQQGRREEAEEGAATAEEGAVAAEEGTTTSEAVVVEGRRGATEA